MLGGKHSQKLSRESVDVSIFDSKFDLQGQTQFPSSDYGPLFVNRPSVILCNLSSRLRLGMFTQARGKVAFRTVLLDWIFSVRVRAILLLIKRKKAPPRPKSKQDSQG